MGESIDDQLSQAHDHRINGQYEDALNLYRQILEAQPDHAEALWGMGLSLMNTGEFDDSLATLERAAEVEPSNQQYLLDTAMHYTMLGMYDEAKPFFLKTVEIDPGSAQGTKAQEQLAYYD